jgi:hypothetical protein
MISGGKGAKERSADARSMILTSEMEPYEPSKFPVKRKQQKVAASKL